MKKALLYIAVSGLVHTGIWLAVLPALAGFLETEVEEELRRPPVESAVSPPPMVMVAEEEEPEKEEEPKEQPEPVLAEPEPAVEEPEPAVEEPDPVAEQRVEPVDTEPEDEEEPEQAAEAQEEQPQEAPAEPEPSTSDVETADASGGGSDAEPAGEAGAEGPEKPAGTNHGGGGGTSTGFGAGGAAHNPPTTAEPALSTADRNRLLRDYQLELAKIFQAHKDYPRRARRQGLEGEVVVEVIVDNRGTILSSRVVKSSGYDGLDQAALKAVSAIEQLPAPPRELNWKQRKLRIPYKYRLS